MKITIQIGIVFAALWILVKMMFFWYAPVGYEIYPLVLLNMLFILCAISFGLYFEKRKETEESNALNDIKNGMTAGVPYALIVGVFVYFYYSKIDPEYNVHQRAEAYAGIQKELDSPEGLEKIKKQNSEFEVLSKEEIFKKLKSGPDSFYSANSTMTMTLLALILLATLNSIFVTIIFRKIVFKDVHRSSNPPLDSTR